MAYSIPLMTMVAAQKGKKCMILEPEDVAKLKALIVAPHVSGYYTDLGGKENASIMLTISLEPRDTWKYGILENSRYAKFAVHSRNEKIEMIVRWKTEKFRKATFSSIEDAAEKLNKWIEKSQEIAA